MRVTEREQRPLPTTTRLNSELAGASTDDAIVTFALSPCLCKQTAGCSPACAYGGQGESHKNIVSAAMLVTTTAISGNTCSWRKNANRRCKLPAKVTQLCLRVVEVVYYVALARQYFCHTVAGSRSTSKP